MAAMAASRRRKRSSTSSALPSYHQLFLISAMTASSYMLGNYMSSNIASCETIIGVGTIDSPESIRLGLRGGGTGRGKAGVEEDETEMIDRLVKQRVKAGEFINSYHDRYRYCSLRKRDKMKLTNDIILFSHSHSNSIRCQKERSRKGTSNLTTKVSNIH